MSNEITAQQINRIIFDFMGCTHSENEHIDKYEMNHLRYHDLWSVLMPVVDRIESMHDDFHGYFGVHISSNSCCIQGTKLRTDPGNEHYAYFNEVVHETKIKATHWAIYQFIQWYNNQANTTNAGT
jgi:hypothetical protein